MAVVTIDGARYRSTLALAGTIIFRIMPDVKLPPNVGTSVRLTLTGEEYMRLNDEEWVPWPVGTGKKITEDELRERLDKQSNLFHSVDRVAEKPAQYVDETPY